MTQRLHARTLRARTGLASVRIYPRLRSTNAQAAKLLEANALTLPAAVVAVRQTAGRGQGANRWWSDAGSLTVTFVLPTGAGGGGGGDQPLEQLPLRAGLAVRAAAAHYLPNDALSVKWPNDVLAGGRKLAGVLCEQVRGGRLIGIGINITTKLTEAPAAVAQRATSMATWTTTPPSRSEMLTSLWFALCSALEEPRWHEQFNQHHALTGRRLTVHTEGAHLHGICRGIDAAGRLRLSDGERIHALIHGHIAEA